MEPRDALFYSLFIGSYPRILGKSLISIENYEIYIEERFFWQQKKTPPKPTEVGLGGVG